MKKYILAVVFVMVLPAGAFAIELIEQADGSLVLDNAAERSALVFHSGKKFPEGKFIVPPDSDKLEQIKKLQGRANFEKVRRLDAEEPDYNIARRVGIFDIGGGGICSGFLVGPDLFLTNHHCVYDEVLDRINPVEEYVIHMDYLHEKNLGKIKSRVLEIVVKDEKLDFALLRLEKPLGAELGWLQPRSVSKGNISKVKVIQHPQGRSKEIARNDSSIVKYTEYVVHYMADTQGGSSGSPVFGVNGKDVIALHHAGNDYYNEGIRMDHIIHYIGKYLWSRDRATDNMTKQDNDSLPQDQSIDDAIRMIENIFQ